MRSLSQRGSIAVKSKTSRGSSLEETIFGDPLKILGICEGLNKRNGIGSRQNVPPPQLFCPLLWHSLVGPANVASQRLPRDNFSLNRDRKTDVTGFVHPEIGQFSPHFGPISLLNCTENLEKKENIHWRNFKNIQWRNFLKKREGVPELGAKPLDALRGYRASNRGSKKPQSRL